MITNYTITKEELAKILRDFRAYGTPISCTLEQFGNFTLIKSDDRNTYHLVYADAEGSFVAEIISHIELLQVKSSQFTNVVYYSGGFFEYAMKRAFPHVELIRN
jgi:hypothetical protein